MTDRILIARPRLHSMQRGKNRFTSVCQCTVYPCACQSVGSGHSFSRISWSIFTKIGTDV